MTTQNSSPLARLLHARWTEPSRTGSLIITVFGDAIAPRGGELALGALIDLLAGVGIAPGVVRTAISRLAAEGWLESHRRGRLSFYRLTDRSRREFAAVEGRIYGSFDRAWDGKLRLAFPLSGSDRADLTQSGYARLAPGVLAGADGAPDTTYLLACGESEALREIAARVWPVEKLASSYRAFLDRFAVLEPIPEGLPANEAMPVRLLLVHDWRRIVLRDPRLPAGLLPDPWPGQVARALCARLYVALAPASERWLDAVRNASGPLPRGPDTKLRFS